MVEMGELLRLMIEKGASDLHLTTGIPPQLRIDGRIVSTDYEVLTPDMVKQLAYSILTEEQKKHFEQEHELDLSFSVKGLSRFRANIYRQRSNVAAALRTIPFRIPTIEELGLPKIVMELASRPKGLILVTGPTGSGKSTTLAAMIDRINTERNCHIITIEDPIEYLHTHKKSVVNQREVGSDTHSFANALKYVLREDPDVILIGEMRDLETIAAALVIAETGHLVLATLHTSDAVGSINRSIDVFPPYQQPQVRMQLSFVLEGILAQRLIPRMNGKGRTLALEIMVATPAVRNLIREEKEHQIYSMMQTGAMYGMQTMNQNLFDLCRRRIISYEEALAWTPNIEEFQQMFRRTPQMV